MGICKPSSWAGRGTDDGYKSSEVKGDRSFLNFKMKSCIRYLYLPLLVRTIPRAPDRVDDDSLVRRSNSISTRWYHIV